MGWRQNVNSENKKHLEMQISEASKDKSYLQAKNPGNAQLWLAVANISKALIELEMKLNMLETSIIEGMKMRNAVIKTKRRR